MRKIYIERDSQRMRLRETERVTSKCQRESKSKKKRTRQIGR